MKKANFRRIVRLVLVDLVVFAVCLLSFAWFHHAKRLLASPDGNIIIGRGDSAETDETIDVKNAHDADVGGTGAVDPTDGSDMGDGPSDSANPTDKTEQTEPSGTDAQTTEPVEPPEPAHKFEALFAPEGVVEKTDTMYRSHDIYMTIEEVTREFSDYVVTYYVYDVYVRNVENLYTVSSSSRYFMEELCEAGNAIAAVSGDFWFQNAHIAIRGGEVLRHDKSTENDFLVMYSDGSMDIFPGDDLAMFNVTDDVYQVWNFGPSLLNRNGKALESFSSKNEIASRNPRSSIGYFEPYHYCFVVADGRVHIKYNGERVYMKGIRLSDLAKIYEELGCKHAYNLDGGDSAYAYYDGKILRQDYDRAHSENEAPRKIYDIICIGEI